LAVSKVFVIKSRKDFGLCGFLSLGMAFNRCKGNNNRIPQEHSTPHEEKGQQKKEKKEKWQKRFL
jgi:hypothetical protein